MKKFSPCHRTRFKFDDFFVSRTSSTNKKKKIQLYEGRCQKCKYLAISAESKVVCGCIRCAFLVNCFLILANNLSLFDPFSSHSLRRVSETSQLKMIHQSAAAKGEERVATSQINGMFLQIQFRRRQISPGFCWLLNEFSCSTKKGDRRSTMARR